jgi:hypothetical protein
MILPSYTWNVSLLFMCSVEQNMVDRYMPPCPVYLGLPNFLPQLALDHDPPDLYPPSTEMTA